ncbi:MAG: UV damage endonuclease UvsE [Chloroflexaceae bacterium]|nr:UV damage endonuclease UvsE [Chloroflexaceae bacterium]
MTTMQPARQIHWLGFPVRVVGQPALRAHDSRRQHPSLSVGLVYLRDILHYLQRTAIRYYRLAPALLAARTPATALHQLEQCQPELAAIAEQVQAQPVRLTMHLEQHIALGSHQAAVVSQSLAAIETRAALLERLGMQAEGSLIVHIGGPSSTPESRRASLRLFAQHYTSLSACARARLAVEHDTSGFSLGDLLELHQQCGVAVVFDYLHWRLYNPENLPLALALGLAVATWQPGVRPEVHLSTARSEAHLHGSRVVAPYPGQHADFVAVHDLLHLLEAAPGLPPFDIMLESKAGDLAVLRARADLARVAPHLAARVG